MTISITLGNLANLSNTTAVTQINSNSAAITTAFGTALNTAGDTMNGTLNMNNNRISNLPGPGSLSDPVRLGDVPNLFNVSTNNGTITGLTSGQIAIASGPTAIGSTMPAMNGDGTLNLSTGALTVTKSSGNSFGTFAFQNYASPPAIGSTTPAPGFFSTLTATSSLVVNGTGSGNITLQPFNSTASGTVKVPNGSSTLLSTAGAVLNTLVGNPAGTTSGSGVMMGLTGAHLTPTYSTRALCIFTGSISNTTGSDGAQVALYYGTGTAPTNGAAITGTAISQPVTLNVASANQYVPFTCVGLATGLTPGTFYWFDLALNTVTGGTASIANLAVTILEI